MEPDGRSDDVTGGEVLKRRRGILEGREEIRLGRMPGVPRLRPDRVIGEGERSHQLPFRLRTPPIPGWKRTGGEEVQRRHDQDFDARQDYENLALSHPEILTLMDHPVALPDRFGSRPFGQLDDVTALRSVPLAGAEGKARVDRDRVILVDHHVEPFAEVL